MTQEQKNTRNIFVKIRVTPEEKSQLQDKASAAGFSDISSFIRHKALYDNNSLLGINELVDVNFALNSIYNYATSSKNDDIKECCETIFTHLNFPTGGVR